MNLCLTNLDMLSGGCGFEPRVGCFHLNTFYENNRVDFFGNIFGIVLRVSDKCEAAEVDDWLVVGVCGIRRTKKT